MSKTKRPNAMFEEGANDDFLELPHEDFSAYCRLCFSISQLEPLFVSRQDVNYQLIGVIEMCTGIKLSAKTDTPSSICLQCRLTTEEFLNFRKLCQRLNRVYRQKRNDMALAQISVALDYHQGIDDTQASATAEEGLVEAETETSTVAEHVVDEPSPMDVVDENCAIEVAAEPSALEASADPGTGDDGQAAGPFIVHEVSDDDDDVEYTGVSAVETIPIDLGTVEEGEPFIKMANDWYCCKLCSRLYQAFHLLAEHFRDAHPHKAKQLRTKEQETSFTPKDSEVQILVIGFKPYYKCDLCDTLLSQKRNLSRHRWRYHGTFPDARKTYCTIAGCEQFFMEKKALSRHLRLFHEQEIVNKVQAASAAAAVTVDDDDDVVVVSDDLV